MKKLTAALTTLLLLTLFSNAQTDDRKYPMGQHPVLKKAKAFSKDVLAYSRNDTTQFVATTVIDLPSKKIYWFFAAGRSSKNFKRPLLSVV